MKKSIVERTLPVAIPGETKKMKNLIATILILVASVTTAFAGETNPNRVLLKEIRSALKSSSYSINWSTLEQGIKIGQFDFKGKKVSAIYNNEDNLVGFTVPVSQSELPLTVSDAITRKYNNWNIQDALIYLDEFGVPNYFVQVKNGNSNLAIKVDLKGHSFVFSRM